MPFFASEASADDDPRFQSHQSILSLARDFIEDYSKSINGESIDIKVGRLDPRLHLHRCDHELEAYLPAGGRTMGNLTVGVRCTGSKPWSLYVPVTIKVFGDVVVTAKALPRNTALDQSLLKVARRNLAKLPQGYFVDPGKLIGMKLKRNMSAGQPLTPATVKAQTVIKRGQQVMLISGSQGVSVRMQGKALSKGALGDLIRVRNLSSKHIVEGTVTADGEVLVGTYHQ
ncbi:flagellar basal body P-ring formation chaperone FlgA [Thiolapillus brandeum]|uniref:flagellar basal body P-ring formation chaperone FlgA n=1 Tax=Thiolapillus brandeum TaxID=1076588 RepID=UPI00155AEE2C|nr:flagellar basal body P-ring formation chaperone FlgA [Thiolapillus brandeum]